MVHNGSTEESIMQRGQLHLASISLALGAVFICGIQQDGICKNASEKTIFSSPDADKQVVPTFIGKNGQPFNAGRDPKTSGLAETRQLPSLTKEQRQQLDKLQKELNLRISSLRENVRLLESKLDLVKGHPGDRI